MLSKQDQVHSLIIRLFLCFCYSTRFSVWFWSDSPRILDLSRIISRWLNVHTVWKWIKCSWNKISWVIKDLGGWCAKFFYAYMTNSCLRFSHLHRWSFSNFRILKIKKVAHQWYTTNPQEGMPITISTIVLRHQVDSFKYFYSWSFLKTRKKNYLLVNKTDAEWE